MKAQRRKRGFTISMTDAEFVALLSLCNAANMDGDHYRWLRDAKMNKEAATVERVHGLIQRAAQLPVPA